jgi:hypothetical protein
MLTFMKSQRSPYPDETPSTPVSSTTKLQLLPAPHEYDVVVQAQPVLHRIFASEPDRSTSILNGTGDDRSAAITAVMTEMRMAPRINPSCFMTLLLHVDVCGEGGSLLILTLVSLNAQCRRSQSDALATRAFA